MLYFVKPLIESRNEALKAVPVRRLELAEAICNYLETGSGREGFFEACTELLQNDESRRIILYLPLELLGNSPSYFKKAYMDAWYRMLDIRDIRENFHFGDCFEVDARPSEGLNRVAKCAHFTPWLLLNRFLTVDQLLCILDDYSDDEELLLSFKDTWRYLADKHILRDEAIKKLEFMTEDVKPQPRQKPLYVSEKRRNWLLSKRKRLSGVLVTPKAKLQGPFSPNVSEILPTLEKVADNLNPYEIVLIGGSQIKGYGTLESDLDIWPLDRLDNSHKDKDYCNPGLTHVFLDSIWLGGVKIPHDKLQMIANSYLQRYEDLGHGDKKLRSIEQLEKDLCQYRLLHKGYATFNRIESYPIMGLYPEMEGDCAFYDYGYRSTATMLYAKYAWL